MVEDRLTQARLVSWLEGHFQDTRSLTFPLCILTLLTALLFGGVPQQGQFTDTIVQVASLPLLVVGVLNWHREAMGRGFVVALVLWALILAAPLLQLIPLPVSVWSSLPGREPILRSYEIAGIAPPVLPISLDPTATWRSFYGLVPSFALFLGVTSLTNRQFQRLLLIAVAFALVSVVLGLMQLAIHSRILRMYDMQLDNEAVGFFTGRNNLAALLYSLLPFAFAGGIIRLRQTDSSHLAHAAICFLATMVLALGIIMARSRAGFGIGLLAIFGSMVIVIAETEARRRLMVGVIGGGITLAAMMVLVIVGIGRIMSRASANVADDMRWLISGTTLKAIGTFFPVGSGYGTFVPVYQMFQGLDTLIPAYINHAHNDWFEITLEGGIVGVVLLALVVLFLLWSAYRVILRYPPPVEVAERTLSRASLVVILSLLLHSLVEYPLRTHALAAVMMLAVSGLVRPLYVSADIRQPQEGRPKQRKRHRSRSGHGNEGGSGGGSESRSHGSGGHRRRRSSSSSRGFGTAPVDPASR